MSAPTEVTDVSPRQGGVYTLHLTREEALDVLRALDDWSGHTPASARAMQRLAARLYPEA